MQKLSSPPCPGPPPGRREAKRSNSTPERRRATVWPRAEMTRQRWPSGRGSAYLRVCGAGVGSSRAGAAGAAPRPAAAAGHATAAVGRRQPCHHACPCMRPATPLPCLLPHPPLGAQVRRHVHQPLGLHQLASIVLAQAAAAAAGAAPAPAAGASPPAAAAHVHLWRGCCLRLLRGGILGGGRAARAGVERAGGRCRWRQAAAAALPPVHHRTSSHLLRLLGGLLRLGSAQRQLAGPVRGLPASALLLFERSGAPALLEGPRPLQLLHIALHGPASTLARLTGRRSAQGGLGGVEGNA